MLARMSTFNGISLMTDHIRAAIFVDFDNVIISMEQVNRRAADLFASRPHQWLSWFERGLHDHAAEDEAKPRRLLVRRCYLNPVAFGRYRSYFTRAAFSVIDCPPLTARGKNSADIYMAIDIVDTLRHESRIDEFILLSADADFTPVLLRLREHDRRTTILTNEQTAAAYRAACDTVVEQEVFFTEALGLVEDDDARPRGDQDGIARAVEMVVDELSSRPMVEAAELPKLLARIPGFRGSNWFGTFSLRSLGQRIVDLHPDLRLAGDPGRAWWIEPCDGEGKGVAEVEPQSLGRDALTSHILTYVAERVSASDIPIPAAKLAHEVLQSWPEVRASEWAGHGSFGALIQRGGHPRLKMTREPPSHVYDEARHSVGDDADRLGTLEPELANLIERIASVTDVPRLTPEEYAFIFDALQELVQGGMFDLAQLSRAIRDRATDHGLAIGRQPINFVLKGLVYSRVNLADPELTSGVLAESFCENVMGLCENRRLELSTDEAAMVAHWITGRPMPPAPGAEACAPPSAVQGAPVEPAPD